MRVSLCARNLPWFCLLGLMLAGCASGPQFASERHSHFVRGQPNYTVAPYQVNGVWYYPRVDYSYDQVGTSSWYGPGFDHRATSDGEIYDMNGLSAAHKTLPLPSVVEVTNLQNGRELQLRVNDRGPFVGDRLIDVSRRAAQLLGFEGVGTARVRVRILKDESIQVAAAAMHGEPGPVTAVAAAAPGVQTRVAAAPRPVPIQMAAVYPAPVQQVAVSPSAAPAPLAQMAPTPEGAPTPVAHLPPPQPVMAAPAPIEQATLSPPPQAVATAAPPSRHYWPSLIAQAHAETIPVLRPPTAPRNSGRIFVQAGAFAVPENAQRARARIAVFGSAEVVPAVKNGIALYRVRVGPIASEAEAQRVLSRVVGSGLTGAQLVGD
jgi:rare lipoprotein A